MADQLSAAIGRMVKFVDISPDSMRHALVGFGMPAWQAEGLVEDYEIYRRGEAAEVARTVQEVTGVPARSLAEFAKDYSASFRGDISGAA